MAGLFGGNGTKPVFSYCFRDRGSETNPPGSPSSPSSSSISSSAPWESHWYLSSSLLSSIGVPESKGAEDQVHTHHHNRENLAAFLHQQEARARFHRGSALVAAGFTFNIPYAFQKTFHLLIAPFSSDCVDRLQRQIEGSIAKSRFPYYQASFGGSKGAPYF